jgi:hypothetical protein
MNPEPDTPPVSEPPFNGSFKLIQPRSLMIQFVGKRMTWCFDWSHLNYVVLRANPDCQDSKVEPADELAFHFNAAKVTLLGWRLHLMLAEIASHNITRVWMLKPELAAQNREVAWISEIFVAPDDDDVLAQYSQAEPPASSAPEQP